MFDVTVVGMEWNWHAGIRRARRTAGPCLYRFCFWVLASVVIVWATGRMAYSGLLTSDPQYIINYVGKAPAGSKLHITAKAETVNGKIGGFPVTLTPSYDETFDVSGRTSAEARDLILNNKGGNGNPKGLALFSGDARLNGQAGQATGIQITSMNVPLFRVASPVNFTDLGGSNKQVLSGPDVKMSSEVPRFDTIPGQPGDEWRIVIGLPNAAGTGDAGTAVVNLNGIEVRAVLMNNDSPETIAGRIDSALAGAGFDATLQTDAVNHTGEVDLAFSDPLNFDKVGRPSLFTAELSLENGDGGPDLGLGFAVPVPEPGGLTLLGLGAVALTIRTRRGGCADARVRPARRWSAGRQSPRRAARSTMPVTRRATPHQPDAKRCPASPTGREAPSLSAGRYPLMRPRSRPFDAARSLSVPLTSPAGRSSPSRPRFAGYKANTARSARASAGQHTQRRETGRVVDQRTEWASCRHRPARSDFAESRAMVERLQVWDRRAKFAWKGCPHAGPLRASFFA